MITSHLCSTQHKTVTFRQTCPGLFNISLKNTIKLAPAVREGVWTAWLQLLWTGSYLLLCTGYCRNLFYPLLPVPPEKVSPNSTALSLCPKQKITVSLLYLAWTFIAVHTSVTLWVRELLERCKMCYLSQLQPSASSVRFLHLLFCHLTAARQARWITQIRGGFILQ